MTLHDRILAACPDWTRLQQIAARVGIPRDEARTIIRTLLANGQLEQMQHSPLTIETQKRYRRKA